MLEKIKKLFKKKLKKEPKEELKFNNMDDLQKVVELNNEVKQEVKFDRSKGIGGSDATRLYEGDWYQLWSEKVGETLPADLSDVLPVQLGIHTEPFNILWFEKKTGRKPFASQQIFFHPKYDYIYAHVDGLISPNKKDPDDMKYGVSILECKHTNAFSNPQKCLGLVFNFRFMKYFSN